MYVRFKSGITTAKNFLTNFRSMRSNQILILAIYLPILLIENSISGIGLTCSVKTACTDLFPC